MKRFALLLCLFATLAYGQAVQTLQYGIYVPRGVWSAADSSKLIFQDTTLATSGKRVIGGSLLDPGFVEDYAAFRALEKNRSIYKASRGDSGNVWPTVWAASITNSSDSVVVWDVLRSRIFMVILKQASGVCGNNNFNDVHFLNGMLRIGTAGGMCEGRYLDDGFFLYSTSGIGEYQGTWNQRNAGLATLTLNASPAIVNATVNSVSAIRDPGGKRDGSGRLAQRWCADTAGGVSCYDPNTNSIWDSSNALAGGWINLLSGGGLIRSSTTAVDSLYWKYSVLSIVADGWLFNGRWDRDATNRSGSERLAWNTGDTMGKVAAIEGASFAGTNAPVFAVAGSAGLYLLHAKANDNTNGGQQLIENDFNSGYMPGNTVGAWNLGATFSTGSSAEDASPYANRLVARAGTHSSVEGIIGKADSLTASGYWNRSDPTDFDLDTATDLWAAGIWLKSHSATNPTPNNVFAFTVENGSTSVGFWLYFNPSGQACFEVDDGTAGADGACSSGDFYDANWHYLIVQRNGTPVGSSTFELYVDGELGASIADNAADGALVGVDEVYVGTAGGLLSYLFSGSVDNPFLSKNKALTTDEIRYMYRQGLAAKQSTISVADALPVRTDSTGYVQANENGQFVAGNQDSFTVFDRYGIPQKRYGTPGGLIKDVAFLNVGGDSLGLVVTTGATASAYGRTQFILPDVRAVDLAMYQWPYKQPAVGERVVVDSAGIGGIFWTGDDAVDAAANMDRSNIFFHDGTYPPFDADRARQTIEGESWDVVIDGTTADDAIDVTATLITIRNLAVKTTAGGGQSVSGINLATGSGTYSHVDNVYVVSSDLHGIYIDAQYTRVTNCYLSAAIDGQGISLDDGSDFSQILGNFIEDVGDNGMGTANAGSDNILISGNHVRATATAILTYSLDNYIVVTGNITDGAITNNSTNGVTSGNATY